MHVDVKKLGNIPDGGGWRYVGRLQGERNRAATPGKPRNQYSGPKLGYAFVHTVIDGHSRVAYTEVHDDETVITAAAVLHRAVAWFAERGVTVERVLSDNGGAYRSHLWRGTCEALWITPKRTRPYRPQTNGKVAIHFDVDTVDSDEATFGLGPVPGGLSTGQVHRVIADLGTGAEVVGLTVAEFIPRQVVALQALLRGLSLAGRWHSGHGRGQRSLTDRL